MTTLTASTLLLVTSFAAVASAETTAPGDAAAAATEVTEVRHDLAKQAPKRRHIRMGLELAAILAVGNRWYWRDNGKPNEIDWQLKHDMSAVRTKLTTADGWRFDGNPFDINALGHPGFGALTHFLARQNNYTLGETFLISTVTSGAWEVFLELAEYGSLNDALSTSTAGIPLGETAYQFVNHAREGSYELRTGVGLENGDTFAVVGTRGDLNRIPTTGDGRTGAGQKVGYAVAMGTDTEGVRSVAGNAKSTLVGYHQNRETHSLFVGINTEFTYRNQLDRTDRAWDMLSTVNVGPTIDVRLRRGETTIDLGADLALGFGMLKSQAYESWRTDHMDARVRHSMQDKERPYYYAMAAKLDPRINVSFRGMQVGAQLDGSVFGSMDGADRDQEMMSAEAHITDHDATARAWVGYQRGTMSVVLDGAVTARGGSMGSASSETTGNTAMLSVGYRR